MKENPKLIFHWAFLLLSVVVLINFSHVNGKCTECLNGGVCSNLSCMCAEGFQGENCQLNENDKLMKCSSKVR